MTSSTSRTLLSCSSAAEPPDDSPSSSRSAERPVDRWDDESEVVPRLHRGAALSAEALESLIVLAGAGSAGDARERARTLSDSPHGGALSPLLHALVARAAEVEHLRRLAGHDELTGLANRRTFNGVLTRELARAARARQPLSLLLLDLDDLKLINDRYGHPAGDRALRELARCAQVSVRDGDLVARLGGDEFGVILPDTARSEAIAIGERLRLQLLEATAADLPLGLSFGAAVADCGDLHTDDLLREADRALYRDKCARKGRATLTTDYVHK